MDENYSNGFDDGFEAAVSTRTFSTLAISIASALTGAVATVGFIWLLT